MNAKTALRTKAFVSAIALFVICLSFAAPYGSAHADSGVSTIAAPGSSVAAPEEPTEAWIENQFHSLSKLEQRRFSKLEQRRFSKLFLYQPRWLGGPKSVVDDPHFFSSPRGNTDIAAEFAASYRVFRNYVRASEPAASTATALQAPNGDHGSYIPTAEAKDPRCRFPARFKFVNEAVQSWGLPPLRQEPCPELEKWLEISAPTGISLGFAAMFPNGPSSMFGHTFLRIQTAPGFNPGHMLSEPVINYAAVPTTSNPLAYTVLGLLGGFPGYVIAEPMYIKLQQYSNAELRDVWDYDLNLTAEQAAWVPLTAWDLTNHRVDYYYFDDNCALLMLHLIEAADPSRILADNYWHWVTPSDTVRTVFDSPGLVRQVRFMPSQQLKFQTRLASLPAAARNQLIELIRSGELEKASQVSQWGGDKATQAQVLDTLVDYIDASEKLSGNDTSRTLSGVRSAALGRRAALGLTSSAQPSVSVPDDLRPEDSHRSHGLGLGIEGGSGRERLQLNWRPALKSLGEGGRGFSQRMSLTFFDTHAALEMKPKNEPRFTLRRFQLVKVQVMSTPTDVALPLSWFVGTEHVTTPLRRKAVGQNAPEYIWAEFPETRFSAGVGLSSAERFGTYAFALAGLDLGYFWTGSAALLRDDEPPGVSAQAPDRRFLLAPTARAGLSTRAGSSVRLTAETYVRWLTLQDNGLDQGVRLGISAFVARDAEIQAAAERIGLTADGPMTISTGFMLFL